MDGLGEKELIARCRQGEPAAWDELFQRYYAPVGRFVFQLAADFTREDVEEICQESFLLVVRHLDSFQGGSQFQTWLFRLAANKARDYRQKRLAVKRGGGAAVISLDQPRERDLSPVDPPAPQPAPDAVLMQNEQALAISRALHEAGPPCQEMLELKYFGDLSYEEIGAILRLNPKTVSSRLSRCLDRLEEIVLRELNAEVRT
jgi:RNA polymerase sigma-70 factor, ECF subfamily